jgi:hypothetical protein
MNFFRKFMQNLFMLSVILLGLFLFFPDVMSQAYQALGIILGPVLILLILIVAALPSRR